MRITYGPAASNTYIDKPSPPGQEGETLHQLTVDWSYDGVYFKYNQEEWITLSIGQRTENHQIECLDTSDKKKIFKEMSEFTAENLKGYSGNSTKALLQLQMIVAGL